MMRHRPDLCVEQDGGGRHDRPFDALSIRVADRAGGNRTDVQKSASQDSGAVRSRATPHRMSRSETSNASSPNALSTSSRSDRPGDDRGRPVRVRGPARSRRSSSGSAARSSARSPRAVAAVHDVALHPRRVVGLQRRASIAAHRRGGAGDRDGRADALAHRRPARRPRRSRARRAPSASSSSGRGGSVCRWRSLWRTTPTWVETWKSTSPRAPTTSSVEPPPMSITSSGVASPRSRAAVAPR